MYTYAIIVYCLTYMIMYTYAIIVYWCWLGLARGWSR